MFWPIQPSKAPWRVLFAVFRRGPAGADDVTAWRRDPLSHPALRAMSQRALGDLPFDPSALDAD